MQRKWIAIFVFAGILIAAALRSQGNSDDEIRWGSRPYIPSQANAIRVRTNLVQVPVVVRDSRAKAVGGLKKSDFELYDNGHQVAISSFSVENTAPMPLQYVTSTQDLTGPQPTRTQALALTQNPRYVALFFDDTSMRMFEVAASREAAKSFIQSSLKPGDKIGIFTTSTTVSLDFTDNVARLLETLEQLRTHQRRADNGSASCSLINPYHAYLITEFYNEHSDTLDLGMKLCGDAHDTIAAAQTTLALAEQFAQDTMGIITDVIHYLGKMPGQRMLVLSSSGFLTQTLAAKQDKVIDEALNANIVINSLDAKGLVAEIPGYTEDGQPLYQLHKRPDLLALYDKMAHDNREIQNDPLALLAESTGGRFYHNRNDLDVGLREMAGAPETSYVLSFSPVNLKANGAKHDLKVRLANSHGMSIQARRGYMAPSPDLTDSEKKQRKLDNAVMAMESPDSIPAQITTEPGALATGEHVLKVSVHVAPDKLPFQTQGDRKVERLIFVTALFDAQNHFLTGAQGVMDLRLKKDTMATLSAQGLDAKLSLQAPPGAYRLRQVIQETGDGRITAISRPIEIR